MQIANTQITFS